MTTATVSTSNLSAEQAVKKSFLQRVGIELEFFADPALCKHLNGGSGCVWKPEAGVNLMEVITTTHPSVQDAYQAIRKMFGEMGNNNFYFTDKRPPEFMCNTMVWNQTPRYDALREALEIECPGHRELVDKMTESAALQVNFSGKDINPFGEDGAFLVNVINWLAPGIAALAHKNLGYGKGHLSIWQKFAKPERFPSCDRWFASVDEMIACINSLPKLYGVNKHGEIVVYPGESQSIYCPTDLTFMWWFLRPKRAPSGGIYLEARYLPSMPFTEAEKYSQQTVNMFEVLLDWFHGPNGGQVVPCKEAAQPAFEYLANKLPSGQVYVPLDRGEWLDLFKHH